MKYKEYDIRLVKSHYASDGNLAVAMLDTEDDSIVNVITVNLDESSACEKDHAYIDTNNNGLELIDWLERNNIAKTTGYAAVSGYCIYPEVKFNSEVLEQMEER